MSPSGSGDAFQRFVAMVALGGSTSTLHPIFQSHGFNPCSSTPTRCHVPKISSTSCSLENSKSNLVLDGRAPRGSRFAKNLQGRGLRIVNDYGRFDSVRQSGDSKRGRKSVGSSRTVDGESSRQERSGSSNAGDESSSRSNGGRGRASQEVDSSSSSSGVALAAHVDVITSVGNAYVKHLVKVRQTPSYRNAAGCVVVVGSVPLRYIFALSVSLSLSHSLKDMCTVLQSEERIYRSVVAVILRFRRVDITLHLVHFLDVRHGLENSGFRV